MLMNAEETSRERDFRNNSSFGLCMNAAKTAFLNAIEPQCARDIDSDIPKDSFEVSEQVQLTYHCVHTVNMCIT